jgi:phage FluMu gp28-like protein
VDQTGVGQPIVEGLKTVIPGIEGINFTEQSKVDMAASLLTLLKQKKLRLPNDRKLILQLNGLRYRVGRQGSALFESPEKATLHDDYLWAFALAVHAAAGEAKYHGHSSLLHNA